MIGKMFCAAAVAAALGCAASQARTFTVLQWNIWQEGTVVPGGAEAIADEIARLKPDFVTLSEVRNYGDRDYTATLVEQLGERGSGTTRSAHTIRAC